VTEAMSPNSDRGRGRRDGLPQGAGGRWLGAGVEEPDPALLAEGWERRFIADGQRSAEVVELYRQLGYEVRLEPIRAAEIPEGCSDCQLVFLLQFKTVYTRKRPSARDGD